MADFKSSWPYIRFMTLAEKAAYVSDLPQDMDTFEVRPLSTSPLFNIEALEYDLVKDIVTPEEFTHRRNQEKSAYVWAGLYSLTLAIGLRQLMLWYYNDGSRTFQQFRNEKWGGYLKRRFWPAALVGWTAVHWLMDLRFTSSYPEIFS